MTKLDFINLGLDDSLAQICEDASLLEIKNLSSASSDELLALQATHDSCVHNLKMDFAIDSALRSADAINPKTVIPLLDLDSLSFDEFGNLSGLQSQLDSLSSSDDTSFLFKSISPPSIVGASIGESGNDLSEQPHSYASVSRLMEQNPNLLF